MSKGELVVPIAIMALVVSLLVGLAFSIRSDSRRMQRECVVVMRSAKTASDSLLVVRASHGACR